MLRNLSRYSALNRRTYLDGSLSEVDFARDSDRLGWAIASLTHPALGKPMDCSFCVKRWQATVGATGNGTVGNRGRAGLKVSLIGVVDIRKWDALWTQQTFKTELPDLAHGSISLSPWHRALRTHPASSTWLSRWSLCRRISSLGRGYSSCTWSVSCAVSRESALALCGVNKSRGRKHPRRQARSRELRRTVDVCSEASSRCQLYTAVVFHISLRRTIRLAYLLSHRPKSLCRCLFSADEQDPTDIYKLLHPYAFRLNFCFGTWSSYRTLSGLASDRSWSFHFNASFLTLNLAGLKPTQQQVGTHRWSSHWRA